MSPWPHQLQLIACCLFAGADKSENGAGEPVNADGADAAQQLEATVAATAAVHQDEAATGHAKATQADASHPKQEGEASHSAPDPDIVNADGAEETALEDATDGHMPTALNINADASKQQHAQQQQEQIDPRTDDHQHQSQHAVSSVQDADHHADNSTRPDSIRGSHQPGHGVTKKLPEDSAADKLKHHSQHKHHHHKHDKEVAAGDRSRSRSRERDHRDGGKHKSKHKKKSKDKHKERDKDRDGREDKHQQRDGVAAGDLVNRSKWQPPEEPE